MLPFWLPALVAPFIGSWLGVLVRRWPQGRPVAMARSQCDSCGHVLGPLELLPLASFALLRGRCRHCGWSIGWFHPVVELAAVTIAVAAIYFNGASGYGDVWRVWIDCGLGWALLCAAWIDAENFRLPDLITLPLILAGLLVTWMEQPQAIYNHATAAALAYLGFRLLNALYRAFRQRDGIGEGDAKLLAAAGAWLGLSALPYVLVGAGLAGIAMALLGGRANASRVNQPIPFGPALALAFFAGRLLAP